uniref:Uncharacterized protein n=1 Tax=Arundo donax TaxID=35708 RepID=A0A0A9A1T1_ARUDO
MFKAKQSAFDFYNYFYKTINRINKHITNIYIICSTTLVVITFPGNLNKRS